MRLLYVVHQFFPDCRSGTEQYCLAVARAARARGHAVTILSLSWDHDRDWPAIRLFEQPYDGFRVLRLDHWRRVNANDVLRDYQNLHLEGWFRSVLDDVAPDAVHFFHLRQLGSNLIGVARARGVRTVVNLMDFWFLCPRFTLLRSDGTLCDGPPEGGAGCVPCHAPELASATAATGPAELTNEPPARRRALLDRLDVQRNALASADVLIAPSHFLAAMFAKNGVPRERVEVVPYGLSAERLAPLPTPRPRRPLRLAFCGVLSPWKAPHVAVEAVVASRADVHLTIHGDHTDTTFAPYIATLRAAAGGDPRITFAGAYGERDAAAVFAAMDALIVPSTWYENTPFVVLEAFRAGVPVLASDRGGLAEVVRHGQDGLLFQPGDATALRQLIERLAGDPAELARLAPKPPHDVIEDFDRFALAYRGA